MERRQREAGLPPLSGPEPLRHDLDANSDEGRDERVAVRAQAAARRSRERRAKKTTSAGRARALLLGGSLLAMLGLGRAMWIGADDGTAQAEPQPNAGQADPLAQP
ncbi:MAG: hypothetical protein ACR2N6_05740, partial [Miltoncostaeaceae bacterium]